MNVLELCEPSGLLGLPGLSEQLGLSTPSKKPTKKKSKKAKKQAQVFTIEQGTFILVFK